MQKVTVILFMLAQITFSVAELGVQQKIKVGKAQFGDWYTTKPIKVRSWDEKCFPENRVDLKSVDVTGQPLWSIRKELVDGKVHSLGSVISSTTYLYREVRCHKNMEIIISLGSDDSFQFWVNGKKVLAEQHTRPAKPDQARIDVKLKKGVNKLLLKVHNGTHGSGFYFKATDKLQLELEQLCQKLLKINVKAWEQSVKYLTKRYSRNYPNGRKYLQ